MADITALTNSNTFEEQMTTINSIITKLNTIEADASAMTLAFSATAPTDASITASTAVLYIDTSDGKLKVKSKNTAGNTVTTYILSSTS